MLAQLKNIIYNMIELENVSKYFGKVRALENISVRFSPNKIYGLLGPNGSGKSTLIKIILKILEPTEGKLFIDNERLRQDFLNKIGYLPEERGLYLYSSVYDALKYFGRLKNVTGERLSSEINVWLRRFDLLEWKKLKIARLSKGNQQKVQLISALLNAPDLLILDEPFTGFDIQNQKTLKDILTSLISPERIIILSTHLMSFVEDICTDLLFLHKGRVIYSGELSELMNRYSKKKKDSEEKKGKFGSAELSLDEIFLNELGKNLNG